MRLSIASLSRLAVAVAMFAIRGGENWSRAFAETWYGLFGGAVVLAIAAVVFAIATRGATGRRRLAIVTLALPALVAVPLLIWVFIALVPLAG